MPVSNPGQLLNTASLIQNYQGDAVDPTQQSVGPTSFAYDEYRRRNGAVGTMQSQRSMGGSGSLSPVNQHIRQSKSADQGDASDPYLKQGTGTLLQDQTYAPTVQEQTYHPQAPAAAPAANAPNALAAARMGNLPQPGQADANGEFGGARAGGAHDTEIIRGSNRSVYSTATGTEQAETPAEDATAGKEKSWNTQNQQAKFAYDHFDKHIAAIDRQLSNPLLQDADKAQLQAQRNQLAQQQAPYFQKLMGGDQGADQSGGQQAQQQFDQASIPHHAPSPGAPLPQDKAADILRAAGGDKGKARQMAQQAGWGL